MLQKLRLGHPGSELGVKKLTGNFIFHSTTKILLTFKFRFSFCQNCNRNNDGDKSFPITKHEIQYDFTSPLDLYCRTINHTADEFTVN